MPKSFDESVKPANLSNTQSCRHGSPSAPATL
jgi:hypothetical protein